MDYPKLYEGFPGVKIRGGISYFLWDREHNGPCTVQTIWDGQPTGPAVTRHLDAYDILVRRNEAVPILEKVKTKGEATLEQRIRAAASRVCSTGSTEQSLADNLAGRVCFKTSVADGLHQMDQLIAARNSGTTMAAAVTIVGVR